MEIIYFELNHWGTDYFPDCEPFIHWMSHETDGSPLRDEDWVKLNRICVKWFPIDMSFNFLITAPESFVERVCPDLLTNEKYHKFLRYPEEGEEVPCSHIVGEKEYFLPYTEENIGTIQYGNDWY